MHRGSYYDSVLAKEMKNKNLFNYDANLTSVVTIELKFTFLVFSILVSLYDVISCDVVNV